MRTPGDPGLARIPILFFALAAMALPLTLGLARTAVAPSGGSAFLEAPATDADSCDGRPPEFMRYHHMDLLKEIRDEVIREGTRGSGGLERCRECHRSRERFCDRCHATANLHPDCFRCHNFP